MQWEETAISGAWLFKPTIHEDSRGAFLEAFTQSSMRTATGRGLDIKQTNVSVSALGTVRGIHFADVPVGQAKYVQCMSGRILDVVVDIRLGSPTFGNWQAAELNSESREALFIAEGLGHAFCALTESATVGYLCSEPYAPSREHGIHPLDPDVGIAWPSGISVHLSAKDEAAPTLQEAAASGLLPTWEDCRSFYETLN